MTSVGRYPVRGLSSPNSQLSGPAFRAGADQRWRQRSCRDDRVDDPRHITAKGRNAAIGRGLLAAGSPLIAGGF